MSKPMPNPVIASFTGFINRELISNKIIPDKGNIFVFICRIDAKPVSLKKLAAEHERILHFSDPAEKYFFTAVDSLKNINEYGENRIETAGKKIKSISENIVTNDPDMLDEIPLFIGAAKFMSEKVSNYWKDFEDFCWFLPENIILQKNGEFYFIHNFIFNNSYGTDKNINQFRIKLENFFLPSAADKNGGAKVNQINGNSPKEKKKWFRNIEKAKELINNGNLKKVVLSRKVDVILEEEPDPDWLMDELKNLYPDCIHFLYHSGKSSFFGATPETLMKVRNSEIFTDVLAGSAPVGSEAEKSDLKTTKNINEHHFVITHIRESLKNFTSDLQISEIRTRSLPNILHLYSNVSAKLLPGINLFSVLKELFPTPAVAGYPKIPALHAIKKIEEVERGLYSGFIGWLNHKFEGHLVVTIRSGLLQDKIIRLFAGAGIVDESVPEEEFIETEMKLQSLLSVLCNEEKNK